MCTGKSVLLMPMELPGIALGWSSEQAGEMDVVIYDKMEQRHFKLSVNPRELILDPTPMDEPTPGDYDGRILALEIEMDLALLTRDKKTFLTAQAIRNNLRMEDFLDVSVTGKQTKLGGV